MSDENGGSPAPREEEEPEGLYEHLMALVPRMREELLELDDERDRLQLEHQRKVAVVEQKKKKLTMLLKDLGEEPPRPRRRRGRPPGAKYGGRRSASHVVAKIIDAIDKRSDEDEFSAIEIHREVGDGNWSDATTYHAFDTLRQAEFIRKTGKRQGRGNSYQQLYRIFDRETGQKLKEESPEPPGDPKPAESISAPSAESLRRIITGIQEAGEPEFSILGITEQLNMASPRRIYSTFRYLRSVGYITETGKTDPPEGGQKARVLFRIDNEHALDDVLSVEA